MKAIIHWRLLLAIGLLAACNSGPRQHSGGNATGDSVDNAVEPQKSTVQYDQYCNGRFSYCVDYPSATLIPQPESDNGDGRVFTDTSGQEVLRVYGALNMDAEGEPLSLPAKMEKDLSNYTGQIAYKKSGADFFIITGTDNEKLFYQKTIMNETGFATAILRYDTLQRAAFNEMSEKLFTGFK